MVAKTPVACIIRHYAIIMGSVTLNREDRRRQVLVDGTMLK